LHPHPWSSPPRLTPALPVVKIHAGSLGELSVGETPKVSLLWRSAF
jgi:hypothetical protein